MARAAASDELLATALLARKSWPALPSVMALHGDEDHLKRLVLQRITATLFSPGTEPQVSRFSARDREGEPTLAKVLEELRTPSFFSPRRLVVVQGADPFVSRYREALEGLPGTDLGGGHLVLLLESLDGRTRLGRILKEKGWVVSCKKPYDRPPPWQPHAPPWDNDLARWVSARAREKGMRMDLELAHAFCSRAGNDLAILDGELEKLRTYLEAKGRALDLQAVEAVVGELREDSLFDLVDSFIQADRPRALSIAGRLFRSGYHPPQGSPVNDPGTIWSLFVGSVLARLRSLRRAHAVAAGGGGAEEWVARGLTKRPFLPRFEKDLRAASPRRIEAALSALRELDRNVKTGGKAEFCLESFILRQ